MSVLTADGLVLKGVLEYPELSPGSRYPLAVLAHQYPSTADSFGPLIEDLLELGLACLAFDERGHGASIQGPGGPVVIETPEGFTVDDFGTAFKNSASRVGFNRIDNDILRVASWGVVQDFIDEKRILLVGASVGGSGALLVAPRVPALKGVITLGPAGAPVFGDDSSERIRAALQGIKSPCYLASSEQDPFSGADNVRSWSAGLGHVTARLVSGSGHGMDIYYVVREELLAFVKASVLKG
jgi:dienelactone hydrolase